MIDAKALKELVNELASLRDVIAKPDSTTSFGFVVTTNESRPFSKATITAFTSDKAFQADVFAIISKRCDVLEAAIKDAANAALVAAVKTDA